MLENRIDRNGCVIGRILREPNHQHPYDPISSLSERGDAESLAGSKNIELLRVRRRTTMLAARIPRMKIHVLIDQLRRDAIADEHSEIVFIAIFSDVLAIFGADRRKEVCDNGDQMRLKADVDEATLPHG